MRAPRSSRTTGPEIIPDPDLQLLRDHKVKVTFKSPGSNVLGSLLFYLLPIGLLIRSGCG